MKKKIFLIFGFWALLAPSLVMAQAKKTVTTKKATVTTTKRAVTTTNKNALQASISRGRLVYNASCLSCHQADGSGVPNMNPPLTQTKWVLGSKAVLIHQVLKGSSGQVEIDGDTFHNTMPPLATLTDQQVADVLTYVRNSFGNKASLVAPAEVKVIRAKTK